LLTEIEGLETLTILTDLTMKYNMIEVVEGLENCKEIKKLVLSHNCIQRLKDIR